MKNILFGFLVLAFSVSAFADGWINLKGTFKYVSTAQLNVLLQVFEVPISNGSVFRYTVTTGSSDPDEAARRSQFVQTLMPGHEYCLYGEVKVGYGQVTFSPTSLGACQ